ncbi:hypothetical protein CRYUN_Cryun19dG0046700 [Craigia yunnanensis]
MGSNPLVFPFFLSLKESRRATLTGTKMEEKSEHRKGLWTEEENRILMDNMRVHVKGKWNRIPKVTGLKRCCKSCRLRWVNYLSPGVKRGDFSEEENDLIIRLHNLLGNRFIHLFISPFNFLQQKMLIPILAVQRITLFL